MDRVHFFNKRNPRHVLLAMPLRDDGNVRWQTYTSIALIPSYPELKGWTIEVVPFGGGDVAHARNMAFHYWRTRATSAGRLVFADSDTIWGGAQLGRLLEHDIPFVCGAYPLKGTYLRWSYNGWQKESAKCPGLWEVQETCGGFLAMQWEVMEKLVEAHQDEAFEMEEPEYRGETSYELCKMGVVARRRVSEDFYLSQRVRALGYEVNLDPKIQVGHVAGVDLLRMFTDQQKLTSSKTRHDEQTGEGRP